MGFFGLFGKNAPSEKQIAKQVTHLKEQYAKPEYRQMAMDKLLEWNTREALVGLLQRFKVVVQSPHYDESEKRWLIEQLSQRGEQAKEVLIDFVMQENDVTYAILALSKLCSRIELIEVLKEALLKRAPEDYRSLGAKMELIAALEEYELSDIAALLIPYLHDHHDDVKCIVLDVITKKKAQDAYPQILGILGEDWHSARVLRHAASKVSALALDISADQKLAPEIEEDFEIKSGKLIARHA